MRVTYLPNGMPNDNPTDEGTSLTLQTAIYSIT